MIENIHQLQRKAISASNRIASQTGNLERSKVELVKLRTDVSGQQSEHDMLNQLLRLKSELGTVSKDNKVYENELKDRIEDCANIKSDLVELEYKRYSLKADTSSRLSVDINQCMLTEIVMCLSCTKQIAKAVYTTIFLITWV